jgi:hypothetical protein
LAWLPKSTRRALTVPTCSVCTCYGDIIFGHVDARRPSWHPANARPNHLPDDSGSWPDLPTDALALSEKRRSVYHAASWFLPTPFSQLGGHPTWIQHAEYPRCPECSRRMVFIGQLSMEDVEKLGEGIYYGFVCHECQVSATSYQQS